MISLIDASIVNKWQGKRIFVLGDVMLDRFVYGSVERISPEAPVPVLHFKSERLMLGGAANVARNIVSLGGEVVLAGAVGADREGDFIAGPLSKFDKIQTAFVRTDKCGTTVKTRFISVGQQIMRLDREQIVRLSEAENMQICLSLLEEIDSFSGIVLSDYAKGLLSPQLVERIIGIGSAHKIPVVVDPKSRDVRRYAGASVLKPNAAEAGRIVGFNCATDQAAGEATKIIQAAAGVNSVVLTRGARGMTIYEPGGAAPDPIFLKTAASEVYDVSGAGDTVTAVLSLALATGADVKDAGIAANLAAGIAVGKEGTAVVRAPELVRALKQQAGGLDAKIVRADEAAQILTEWKIRKFRIGFTNGCFDLLHPGHVDLLKRARASCDRLIVAMNSDASVRRLKGEGRPVQNEYARTVVMASIDSVDLVTLFDEDTPARLIEMLKPDILIKGADYTVSTVVGADFVKSYGGQVMLVPLHEGHSTTSIIARAKVEA